MKSQASHGYRQGILHERLGNPIEVLLSPPVGYGNVETVFNLARIQQEFPQLTYVFLVGVAGAYSGPEGLEIGDVIISQSIFANSYFNFLTSEPGATGGPGSIGGGPKDHLEEVSLYGSRPVIRTRPKRHYIREEMQRRSAAVIAKVTEDISCWL